MLTPDNISSSLVLGETSYVNQYVEKSPWFNQLQLDVRYASNLFIIGYSLSDYHISAVIFRIPDIDTKTFFIQGCHRDDMFVRRTKAYGTTLFIGLEGFAAAVRELPRPEPLADVVQLKSFRALDPHRDKKGLKRPTANEVLDLLVLDTFNYSRLISTLPEETYVISRSDEVDLLISQLSSNRSVIVDGRLGNGKTIFLKQVTLSSAIIG